MGRTIDMPKFGDRVTVKARLVRYMRYEKWESYSIKYWKSEAMGKPRKGIFLGQRTLQNGRRITDYELGCIFEPTEYIKAYLVCTSPNEKPFFVLPEDIETIEGR
jgi:hypothetical protein